MLWTTAAMAQRQTFVLVHGAWGGGWSFKQTDSVLRASGHMVYRPTLTGLGERAHLASADVDLYTHVNDVVNTILFENLQDVVLVGHSYGGMVVTGVADSLPERIKKVIYLDAFVPEDGQSVATAHSSAGAGRELPAKDGLIHPFWVQEALGFPRDVPQPAKTFSQPLALKNEKRLSLPTTYILTYEGDAEKDTFAFFAKRAHGYGWKVVNMEAGHNPQMDVPDKLAVLLGEVASQQ